MYIVIVIMLPSEPSEANKDVYCVKLW